MKKRVLIVSPNGVGSHYGGPGMNFYRLMNKLLHEFDFDLLHYSTTQQADHLFKHIFTLRRPRREATLRVARFRRPYQEWADRMFKNYDLVYGLMGFLQTLTPLERFQELGVPSIVKIASHKSELANTTLKEKCMNSAAARIRIIQRLSGVIAISNNIYRELVSSHVNEERVFKIANGVDTNYFHPRDQRLLFKEKLNLRKGMTLLFTGGMTPRKQPHLIIEAMHLLNRKNIDAQAVFVGPVKNPAYMEKMLRMAGDYGLNDHILFYGFQRDLTNFYQSADLFCLPSLKEGMSNSLLEALASGLPILTTDISGSEELVNETGMIISDARSIADAITAYIKNPELLIVHSSNAVKMVRERFSTDIIARKISQTFYQMILNFSKN